MSNTIASFFNRPCRPCSEPMAGISTPGSLKEKTVWKMIIAELTAEGHI